MHWETPKRKPEKGGAPSRRMSKKGRDVQVDWWENALFERVGPTRGWLGGTTPNSFWKKVQTFLRGGCFKKKRWGVSSLGDGVYLRSRCDAGSK